MRFVMRRAVLLATPRASTVTRERPDAERTDSAASPRSPSLVVVGVDRAESADFIALQTPLHRTGFTVFTSCMSLRAARRGPRGDCLVTLDLGAPASSPAHAATAA